MGIYIGPAGKGRGGVELNSRDSIKSKESCSLGRVQEKITKEWGGGSVTLYC